MESRLNTVLQRKTKFARVLLNIIHSYSHFDTFNNLCLEDKNEARLMPVDLLAKKGGRWEPSNYWIPDDLKYSLFKVVSRDPNWLKEQYANISNEYIWQQNFFQNIRIRFQKMRCISKSCIEIIQVLAEIKSCHVENFKWSHLFKIMIMAGIGSKELLRDMYFEYDDIGNFILTCCL